MTVDTANGNAVVASGTGQSFTLPFPATVTASPTVVCTFTNTALTPGGVYAATLKSKRQVFQIDPEATAGTGPVIGRLVSLQ